MDFKEVINILLKEYKGVRFGLIPETKLENQLIKETYFIAVKENWGQYEFEAQGNSIEDCINNLFKEYPPVEHVVKYRGG